MILCRRANQRDGKTADVQCRLMAARHPLSDGPAAEPNEAGSVSLGIGSIDGHVEVAAVDKLSERMRTANPAFKSQTPIQVIERGEAGRIWRMIFQIDAGSEGSMGDGRSEEFTMSPYCCPPYRSPLAAAIATSRASASRTMNIFKWPVLSTCCSSSS